MSGGMRVAKRAEERIVKSGYWKGRSIEIIL
jgi:hypothetical protein